MKHALVDVNVLKLFDPAEEAFEGAEDAQHYDLEFCRNHATFVSARSALTDEDCEFVFFLPREEAWEEFMHEVREHGCSEGFARALEGARAEGAAYVHVYALA